MSIVWICADSHSGECENCFFFAAYELTPDDLREINDTASKITVQGARYPEKLEQMTGR